MQLHKILSLGAIGAALVASSASADVRDLRIAVDVPYEPMEYRTPDGELTGFDIDLGNALCAEIGIDCEWVVQGWDGIIPGLMARKYDAIMSSMTINEQRREQVLFSEPYITPPSAWFAPADVEIGTPSNETLEGMTIGVQRGTLQDNYATDMYGDVADVKR
ncbi:MAG TPA: transporter substrate-binding domain-containing protein, partial [Halomonas sp.]|nr:transporter substrate-binding domain-containing protein [Halomonas sp.]